VYERVAAPARQLCWAHLKRNFQALVDGGTSLGATVGSWALETLRKLFQHGHRFRAGELDGPAWQEHVAAVQGTFRTLLGVGSAGTCRRTAALCRDLEAWWEALWTFATRAGVEPTNNAAERALRPAV